MARDAVQQVADSDTGDLELDPASRLFFEFAAPLLMNARTDEEFMTDSILAEFVWTASHFDAASQAILLNDFITEAQVPDQMVPWLIEVYGELAARKLALVGE